MIRQAVMLLTLKNSRQTHTKITGQLIVPPSSSKNSQYYSRSAGDSILGYVQAERSQDQPASFCWR